MRDQTAEFINVADLRVGHYVYLDVGWLGHPFALNSFRIATLDQIQTIRGLGLERLRFSSAQSVFSDGVPVSDQATSPAGQPPEGLEKVEQETQATARAQRRELLSNQRQRLQYCENQFNDAARDYKAVVDTMHASPAEARTRCEAVIGGMIAHMGSGDDDSLVRLLSERAGEKTSLHSINVSIISLLLGKAMGYSADELRDIGVGALLHDIGKMDLPDRLRWNDNNLSSAETQAYREHVAKGTQLAKKLNLTPIAQRVIAQHHELANGSGFPLRLKDEQISGPARIVALVNRYDELCNSNNPISSVTPHEALSLIYAQQRGLFDPRALSIFVRLMGVYPPGSVIELSDGRYAMVVSVNSGRPLRPHIVIHDSKIPAHEALIVDLEHCPEIGIRRSLKPQQLPKASFDYLSPRKRLCYFFERGRDVEPAVSAV